jgi:hypothetical protein
MKMTVQAFEKACVFIEKNGRPLDIARFRFHFFGDPASDVLAELVPYQNADGGFGNALEPDLRAPESSALATSIAFQVCREIGVSHPGEMLSKAAAYLVRTINPEKLTWRIIPESAENAPHAPWWTQTGREENFGNFGLNPTAELLGYLYEHSEYVPKDLLSALSAKITTTLAGLTHIDMHDFLCCKRLVDSLSLSGTKGLESDLRLTVLTHMKRLLSSAVSMDPAQWASYSLRPLQVADSPESLFYELLQDGISANLDYEITTQQEDGSWAPTWSWGGLYPDLWEKVVLEWSGVFMVDKLLALKRYGRIEYARL